jgi:hypothetical protein
MKEVFENLAEQAMVHVPGQTGLHTRAFSLEKFAELIVAECLKIAKNREDEFESAGLLKESNAVGNVAYRISRQFGVKR